MALSNLRDFEVRIERVEADSGKVAPAPRWLFPARRSNGWKVFV